MVLKKVFDKRVDVGPKPGLSPEQWPVEVENGDGELVKVGESEKESKVRDSAADGLMLNVLHQLSNQCDEGVSDIAQDYFFDNDADVDWAHGESAPYVDSIKGKKALAEYLVKKGYVRLKPSGMVDLSYKPEIARPAQQLISYNIWKTLK